MSFWRQAWRGQPTRFPGVTTDSLANGLRELWVGSQPDRTVILKTATVPQGNATTVPGIGGFATRTTYNLAPNGLNVGDPNVIFGANNQTIFIYRRALSLTPQDTRLFGYETAAGDRVSCAAPFSDGNIYFDYGDATSGAGRVSTAYTKDMEPEVLVFVADVSGAGGFGRQIWRRGVQIASNSGSSSRPATLNPGFWLNGSSLVGASDDNEIYTFAVWDRALYPAEIRALSDNPEILARLRLPSPPPSFLAASGVTGTSATTNANDTSAASGTTTILGTLARTNANDTCAASGAVGGAVVGTSATTNANDTSAASGSTTITGTLARTNANDSVAASGWVGVITGTLARTNNNDTVVASGTAGSGAAQSGQGNFGPAYGDFWKRQTRPVKELRRKLARILKEPEDAEVYTPAEATPALREALVAVRSAPLLHDIRDVRSTIRSLHHAIEEAQIFAEAQEKQRQARRRKQQHQLLMED